MHGIARLLLTRLMLSIWLVNGPNLWEKTGLDPVQPPAEKKQSGRSKKLQTVEPDEVWGKETGVVRMKKKGMRMSCTKCKATEHNRRCCPKVEEEVRTNKGEAPQPYQGNDGPRQPPSKKQVLY